MADLSDLFWQASLQDIKQGYIYQQNNEEFVCLICGRKVASGIIYPSEGQLYEAQKFIKVHIANEHHSTFHFLLNMDKKLTGLTEHQKSILELFYEGNTDDDVAVTLGTGSKSTIRNHRFTLREKQKQAKVFLAIMELLGEKVPKKQSDMEESDKILAAYFKQGLNGPLESFPLKQKKRMAILRHILKMFNSNETYSEKEVNTILKRVYNDYALLRRLLIEYGFMDRTADGSSYWIKL